MFFLSFSFQEASAWKKETSRITNSGGLHGTACTCACLKKQMRFLFCWPQHWPYQLHSLWWVTLQTDVECHLWRPPSTSLYSVSSTGKSENKREEVTQKACNNCICGLLQSPQWEQNLKPKTKGTCEKSIGSIEFFKSWTFDSTRRYGLLASVSLFF